MLDELERGLVQALHIDGRAPFSRIAEVLGVSTQTITRRYQRLRSEAALRVVGLADLALSGEAQWIVRIGAAPGTAEGLAAALARRPDTSWVKLTSAGTEIFAMLQAPQGLHPPVLQRLPHTRGITSISAHCLLHTYLGGPSPWRGRTATLSPNQQADLTPHFPTARPAPLTDTDRALLDALRHDGRTTHTDLARATGTTPGTVARHLTDLRARGTLYFDVEVDTRSYGITTQVLLWMAIAPAHLDTVATTLSTHEELAAVVATTGPTNLLAMALCESPADLHRYLTRRLGAVEQIAALETTPVSQTVKAAGHLGALPRTSIPR